MAAFLELKKISLGLFKGPLREVFNLFLFYFDFEIMNRLIGKEMKRKYGMG